MKWLTENWELVAVMIGALTSVVNALTDHWKDKEGLSRALFFVTEILSFLKSKNVEGLIKLPMTSAENKK